MLGSMTDMEKFIQEGTALLADIRHSHELAVAKEESANNRIKFIQWIIVVFLVPMLVTSGTNSVKNAKQMDSDEIYELFSTKERTVFLQNRIYEMNEKKFMKAASKEGINTDEEYGTALKEFIGDESRGGK